MQSHHPSINGSTVYRTLDLLAELGVARHVHLGHGPSRWQLCPDRPCWYLACTVCGKVAEPDPGMFGALVADVAERTGFVLDAGHFAITGTCAQFAGQQRAPLAGLPRLATSLGSCDNGAERSPAERRELRRL